MDDGTFFFFSQPQPNCKIRKDKEITRLYSKNNYLFIIRIRKSCNSTVSFDIKMAKFKTAGPSEYVSTTE